MTQPRITNPLYRLPTIPLHPKEGSWRLGWAQRKKDRALRYILPLFSQFTSPQNENYQFSPALARTGAGACEIAIHAALG